ncbi:hypothetical protein JB92DRAFT_410717 [Gautieria morchelliformis]|nr:hypothetical protein JB92DRAFT_410717 [Gautieria morchelliformis]
MWRCLHIAGGFVKGSAGSPIVSVCLWMIVCLVSRELQSISGTWLSRSTQRLRLVPFMIVSGHLMPKAPLSSLQALSFLVSLPPFPTFCRVRASGGSRCSTGCIDRNRRDRMYFVEQVDVSAQVW